MTTITRTGSTVTPSTTNTAPVEGPGGTTETQATTGTTPAQTPVVKDKFETGGTAGTPATVPQYQQDWNKAVSGYQDKIGKMFTLSAEDLADGKTAPKTSADITPEMRKELTGATKDLFMSMPVGVLAPGSQQYLKDHGVNIEGLENKPLKELGKVGGDLAKKMADDLKDKSPGAYYGIAAAGAVAVGAYGITKGSGALEKLGIKPEFDTKVFNDQVNVRAKGAWDKNFTNPNLTLGADGSFKINKATLTTGANVNVAGEKVGSMKLKTADANLGIQTESWGAAGKVNLGEGGKITAGEVTGNATTKLLDDKLTLAGKGKVTLGEAGKYTSANLNAEANYKLDGGTLNSTTNFNLGAGGRISNGTTDFKYTTSTTTLGAGADFGEAGKLSSYRLSGAYNANNLSVTGNGVFEPTGSLRSATFTADKKWSEGNTLGGVATFGPGARLETLGLKGSYTQDNFRLSGQVDHNFTTDVTTGSLSAGYKVNRDLDIAVKGSLDTRGESRIGIGATWRF